MKEQIITAFKTKYQSFGLSNEAIDRIASAKEKTVTKPEDIEAALADVETMTLIAKEVQKMRDGEIQKRTDLQKNFDTYKASHPDKTDDPDSAFFDDGKRSRRTYFLYQNYRVGFQP